MVRVPELKHVPSVVAEEPEFFRYQRNFIQVKAEHEYVIDKVVLHRSKAVMHHTTSVQ
jgi:hypothetical protein